jgi:3-hydroxyisobutyrate dehydrogenase
MMRMTDTLTVSVLGTGIMGAAMARNLVKAGHTVRVWNRTQEKAQPLAADGARVVPTVEEAVRGADVLGTRQPAEAGQLTVLAAGPLGGGGAAVADRDKVTPVFDAVGAKTVWLDNPGEGTRLKLVANSWVLALTHAGGEVLALAEALHVDPDKFFELIAGGPLDNGYLRAKTDLIRNDKLTPASFAVSTAGKDARLIVEAGRSHGVRLDIAEAGAERFRRAEEQGHGDADMAASYHASFDK